jgi:hypothetical protein
MSKHADGALNRLSLWEAHHQGFSEERSGRSLATRRTQPRDGFRRRKRRRGPDQLASSFDRDLASVGASCELLRGALMQVDLLAVEGAAYALASACLVAEATAIRMIAASPVIPESTRFTRKALVATSCVVTALFGEALAETSKWASMDPKRPGLRRLRAVLGQLSQRVDVREIDVGIKHCGGGLEGLPSSARRGYARRQG